MIGSWKDVDALLIGKSKRRFTYSEATAFNSPAICNLLELSLASSNLKEGKLGTLDNYFSKNWESKRTTHRHEWKGISYWKWGFYS